MRIFRTQQFQTRGHCVYRGDVANLCKDPGTLKKIGYSDQVYVFQQSITLKIKTHG